MLVGYNTNVPYKGNLYHIQTEDSGLKNPVIITLLYIKGTILSSKKISYAHIASSPDYKEKVRELMKEQHKTMMKELINGKHTEGEDSPKPESLQSENLKPENFKDDNQLDSPGCDAGPTPAEPVAAESGQGRPPEDEPRAPRSLDDILLDFIINKGK
ncbi:MAG: hypothetical protein C0402_14845 [Thermodesulfovibrio sp.]|nr:hypothetical protein [Thermodesulfovibrio sp.]